MPITVIFFRSFLFGESKEKQIAFNKWGLNLVALLLLFFECHVVIVI